MSYCYDSEDEKKQYAFHEIVIHASRLGRESTSASCRSRERLFGLERYLMSCFDEKTKTSQSRTEHCHEDDREKQITLPAIHSKPVDNNVVASREPGKYGNFAQKRVEHQNCKAGEETMMKLAEAHKKQKDQLRQKIIELEKKVNDKQRLELEIEEMKGAAEFMKNCGEDGYIKAKIKSTEENLKEKADDLANLEELHQALHIKERKTNDKVQDAQKELINGLKGRINVNATVGVKRMGNLDGKPIFAAAKRKYPAAEAVKKAMEFTSLLDGKQRDPSWYPFKIIIVNEDPKEVINKEDDCLKTIKSDRDDKAYCAVIRALSETNEYNSSGRYPVPELWNFREEGDSR